MCSRMPLDTFVNTTELRSSGQPEAVMTAIVQVLDGFGILHAENVERLPPVAKDGMCLLTWMAADGTKAG